VATEQATATVIERDLEVAAGGRRVPAVLWTSARAAAPLPLVLVGHGGGGHKRHPKVVNMATGLVT